MAPAKALKYPCYSLSSVKWPNLLSSTLDKRFKFTRSENSHEIEKRNNLIGHLTIFKILVRFTQ